MDRKSCIPLSRSVMVEVTEEVEGPHHQDHPNIVKGKRTKRQRPQSPTIPLTITTQYSSSGEGGYGSNGDHCINNNNITNNSSSSSAEEATHDHDHDHDHAATTTDEDEYTAKCLILLAQGNQIGKESSKKYYDDQDQDFGTEKFISKKYIEAPISGNGKAGMYVYECKTCGRTFPSFQALGGHRASHKKSKNMSMEDKKTLLLEMSDDDEEPIFKNKSTSKIHNNNNNSSSLSLELLSNKGMPSNCNTNNHLHKSASFPRIHECAHCGAEFASGQALGGHMRRHRGVPAITNTTLSLGQLSSPETIDQESDELAHQVKRSRSLSLDLNLPAPEDDHNKDSQFVLASKQQQKQQGEEQPALVLSTAAPKLVDCHN
ncbi:hypothetical protein ACH5RR_016349 [Cinchona calisaya]|uniref:C2H2-type domain-containing protein n=1 Tax=Cinchona calisaya TaxID=153742 RepID=A0ABD2ZZ42_9GENT